MTAAPGRDRAMTCRYDIRGSATRGAPARFDPLLLSAVLLALAASPSSATRALRATAPVGDHGAALRGAAPVGERGAALRFAGLPWDSSPAQVAAALASHRYRVVAEHDDLKREWRGRAFGRAARVTPEFDSSSRLVAVTLRFEPDPRGSAMQRYAELVDAMRRLQGEPAAQVEPGRTEVEERTGRRELTRRFGPRTAATMWTDAVGGAAAAQLDGDGVVWLRYESPRWEEAMEPRRARR